MLAEWRATHANMTLRQYYAGLAMQGMNANPEFRGASGEMIARYSVDCADALIAALEAPKEEAAHDPR